MFGNVKILQRKGSIRGITCNGGLGTGVVKKNRLSTKVITHSKTAKHSFVVLYIVRFIVAIKLNNFEFKLLPFLLEDILGLCGRRRSRDLT